MTAQIRRLSLVVILAISLFLADCSALPASPPTATPAEISPTPIPSSTAEAVETADAIDSLIPIVVWLPPQFDPDKSTPASQMLKTRLETFNLEHPNLAISYRIKQESGPAGLLDALEKTSKVAPQALPDLVLFPYSELYNAAGQSLIYPYSANIAEGDETEWYRIAEEVGMVQGQFYGLPMAADGLIMVYNTRLIESLPVNWDDLLRSGYSFSFPAGDPAATFTLGLYQAENNLNSGPDSLATLEADRLAAILAFYSQVSSEKLLPSNSIQIETDQQAWDAFISGNRQVTTTWFSRYLAQSNPDLQATPLLTRAGNPFTLIQGWGWALANPDPNKQLAAAELARYLTEAEFAGQWTEAENLLPFRPGALSHWQDNDRRILASQLLPSAAAFPPPDTLDLVAPLLQSAVIKVLSGEFSALEAAQEAADSYQN